ncbi:MAG: amino acid permease [Bacteroidota bacterium]
MAQPNPKVGLLTASSLVIAAMIGTGVFTSLGFQVIDIKTGFSIMMLWFVGGVIAFCGAVTYAELGAAFPRSGGEYNLLSRLYHPSLGFVAGWVSATVGFAAPASLAAMALASYVSTFVPGLPENHIAAGCVLTLSVLHGSTIKGGSLFQNFFTILKIGLIVIFVIVGFTIDQPQSITLLPQSTSWSEIISAPFAVSLIFVSYAYTGWNSSIYIIDEIDNPVKNLPKSLFLGTLIVMVLYLLLNFIFLYSVPIPELKGQIEVGFISGSLIFGDLGGKIMAIVISLLLLSTVSAYVFLGPRITQVMGEDFRALKWLSIKNERGIPRNAFLFSTFLSLLFIYTSSFDQILVYTTFLLILITTLTVGGIFVLRVKYPEIVSSYRTWGYPITPLVFLVISVWTLVFVFIDKPLESMIGVGILVIGSVIYFLSERGNH